jgi:hypothetical protein
VNLLLLLAALLPWGNTAVSVFTRVYIAMSILSVEMQVATVTGLVTLHSLITFNVVLAVLLVAWQRTRRAAFLGWPAAIQPPRPWPAWAMLGGVVLLLNVWLPLEAADPYHLDRVAQIERLGTLEYDPDGGSKANVLGSVYELALADLRQIPLVGRGLVRMHGLLSLLLFGVTVAAVQTWFRPGLSRWPVAALLVLPPLFQQFVLIKNDLFLALPAFVALAWLLIRVRGASWQETAWAGWLAGIAVGGKLTNFPVAFAMMVGVGVLVIHYARAAEARWTIWIAAFHFAAFAAIFPDADLHHRLALAPGLLVVSVALSLLQRGEKYSDAARLALVPVVVLSCAQLLRSSVLYILRAS